MKREAKAVEKRHRTGESAETISFQDQIEKKCPLMILLNQR